MVGILNHEADHLHQSVVTITAGDKATINHTVQEGQDTVDKAVRNLIITMIIINHTKHKGPQTLTTKDSIPIHKEMAKETDKTSTLTGVIALMATGKMVGGIETKEDVAEVHLTKETEEGHKEITGTATYATHPRIFRDNVHRSQVTTNNSSSHKDISNVFKEAIQ